MSRNNPPPIPVIVPNMIADGMGRSARIALCAPITLNRPSATASTSCISDRIRLAACAKNAPTHGGPGHRDEVPRLLQGERDPREQHVAEHAATQSAHDRQREDPDHVEPALLRVQRAGERAGDDRRQLDPYRRVDDGGDHRRFAGPPSVTRPSLPRDPGAAALGSRSCSRSRTGPRSRRTHGSAPAPCPPGPRG